MTHVKHQHTTCWSRTPHYRPGGKLTAEQLNVSQDDAARRDRLVNVAMHGVGVAYGFRIRTDDEGKMLVEDGRVDITCGLAFDKYGRMLFWGGGYLKMEDIIGPKPNGKGNYTLAVHYAETSDRGGAFDPCHEGTDWVDRCVVFTLTKGCRPYDDCAPDVPVDECMTRPEWICTRNDFERGDVPKDKKLEYACAEVPPLAASDCGRVSYDPEAGIPLSCVEIWDVDQHKNDCEPRYDFCHCGGVDSCSVRPVAYRSRLLYELINKDDVPLARIASYSWSDWELEEWSDKHKVPFELFKRRAKACPPLPIDPRGPSLPIDPKEGFTVMFTRPVQRRTLHPLSLLMDIYILKVRPSYWEPWRIPTQILHLDENGGVILRPESDEEYAWGALICPEKNWVDDELDDSDSTILDCAHKGRLARVEISVRGQIVRDRCGLMIDARPVDIDEDDPCGNRPGQGRPGDTWISMFRIGTDAHKHTNDTPSVDQEIDTDKASPTDIVGERSET